MGDWSPGHRNFRKNQKTKVNVNRESGTNLSRYLLWCAYVPSDYDYELKKAYGDYMKFLPVEERGGWHDNTIILNPDVSLLIT